jgi:hypothetical protein
MKLTPAEIEYLAAWAREEWETNCYRRPGHRLQLAHRITGADLIQLIKVWTRSEGKKDLEILSAADNDDPQWPWETSDQCAARVAQAGRSVGLDSAAPSMSK